MNRKELRKALAYLIIFIFLANFLGTKLYWYHAIWYFDMIMHFLGGFWVALLGLYLLPIKPHSFSNVWPILAVLSFVLVVGAGWEVFEVVVDKVVSKNPMNYFDTFSDIFFDLSGGASAMLYAMKNIMPRA